MHELGKWAVIDIETTGVDPSYDEIIDIGYLQFEGTSLVKRYSSLVRYSGELSQFIQKLTGIKNSMVHNAPLWRKVEPELMELEGHYLIAHNADFEEKFLSRYFEANVFDSADVREEYVDSLFFLALMFPNRSSLKLESLIVEFGIADSEAHRGLEDSVDLLKVVLFAAYLSYKRGDRLFTQRLFKEYRLDDYWFTKFYNLSKSELLEIAQHIDFDLESITANYLISLENFEQADVSEKVCLHDVPVQFDGNTIEAIFKNEEKIKEILPNYRFRSSQLEMAKRVGQSFKNGLHALIQAPTGTGKTLAYLVASALYCLEKREKVLVATGTKALQNQAINKDVPQMYKILGLDQTELTSCRLVGSGNHYCELIFRNLLSQTEGQLGMSDFGERFSKVFYELLFAYNARTTPDKCITREDVPHVLKRLINQFLEMDKEIIVDYRSCIGHKCPFYNGCSYTRGLRKAKESDIIIGNHSLMFSWPRGFPRPLSVIVDEAHKLEQEGSNVFSHIVSGDDINHLIKSLTNFQGVGALFYLLNQNDEGDKVEEIKEAVELITRNLRDHIRPLHGLTEDYFKRMPKYTSIYWNELPMIQKDSLTNSLGTAIRNHLESMEFELENLNKLLFPYFDRWEVSSFTDDSDVIAYTKFETFACQVMDILEALKANLNIDDNYFHSLKFHEDFGFSLEAIPIDIGQKIHDGLLETSHSVVLTSATLANATGDQGTQGVEWLTGYSYLKQERRFKKGFYLPAVYDYQNNSKIYLCDDSVSFNDSMFVEKTLKQIIPLIRNLGGRTLLLFSAKIRFEKAREILLKEFEGEIPLFIQGMGSSIIEDYKKSSSGILLGMESFGEGIDVPGDSLQFIFIDKIPDLRQDLVIRERRDFFAKNFGNEFNDYFLAHRARGLHQKLGRLLRTENDRGGAIIVDSRIKGWKSGTQSAFFKLMKPYNIERTTLKDACVKVQDFIQLDS